MNKRKNFNRNRSTGNLELELLDTDLKINVQVQGGKRQDRLFQQGSENYKEKKRMEA